LAAVGHPNDSGRIEERQPNTTDSPDVETVVVHIRERLDRRATPQHIAELTRIATPSNRAGVVVGRCDNRDTRDLNAIVDELRQALVVARADLQLRKRLRHSRVDQPARQLRRVQLGGIATRYKDVQVGIAPSTT
jgi:hypothetical protein